MSIRHMRLADFKRIHWSRYLSRKVIILAACGIAGFWLEHHMHIWFAGKGGEMAIGTAIEHIFFGVPVVEE